MKTYLFDFDGTLVDSMPTYSAVMLRILDENYVNYPADIIKIITPLGTLATADYFVRLGIPLTKIEILKKMQEYMLDAYLNRIPAKKHVSDVLAELKRNGASLNVLTASPHLTLDPCLKRLQLYDLFDHVWSCDDFNTTKSNPAIYQSVADKIGVPIESILFLDDNPDADRAAKKSGIQVCGVYDASSAEFTNEMKEICDYYILDFSELPSLPF